MYETVHVQAAGESTPDRFALTASQAGFDGLVLRNQQSNQAAIDHQTLAFRHEIDVIDGIEIKADDKASASGAIGNQRPEAEVLLVEGRDPDMNRFIAESSRVDVLADPMGGEGDVNHVIATSAAKNQVALEINLGGVLRESGGKRVRTIQQVRKLTELIEDADAPYVISGSPRSHLELRGPRELIAVGQQIGLEKAQIREGLAEWGRIAERTRTRRDPTYISPGVHLDEDTSVDTDTGRREDS